MLHFLLIQHDVANININIRKWVFNLREWLRALRGNRSSTEIAGLMGITQQYYNYIENGKRQKNMDIQLCEKISKIFDISIEEIVKNEMLDKEG